LADQGALQLGPYGARLEANLGGSVSRRFIVIQLGARMHYAVPAMLARAGMLERLYTEIHAGDGVVRYTAAMLPDWLCPKPIRRLRGRVVPPEISRQAIRTCPYRALLERAGIGRCEPALHRRLLREGCGGADALYTLSNGDLPVVKVAKEQGLFVIHEQVLNPDVGWILREERAEYPGIERQDSVAMVEEGIQRDKDQWAAADRILVPSDFVREITLSMGAEPGKTVLVPYGVPESWLQSKARPRPGRVLFVGTVGLRKGNHYLAMASRLLASRGVSCEIHVVGPADPVYLRSDVFNGPSYLGQAPRSEVKKEFLEADVFVLPTISDSFALVHLEAMACGVPVITTPNCGSVVRDGVDGFLVPIRDAHALAERIELLISDRPLRQRMSENARKRASEFTWQQYQERLLAAVSTTAASRPAVPIHV
jgi:glycosyltransferase involved in cell wall biosynthesis